MQFLDSLNQRWTEAFELAGLDISLVRKIELGVEADSSICFGQLKDDKWFILFSWTVDKKRMAYYSKANSRDELVMLTMLSVLASGRNVENLFNVVTSSLRVGGQVKLPPEEELARKLAELNDKVEASYEGRGVQVDLQVLEDGSWRLFAGDSKIGLYRGHWGRICIPGRLEGMCNFDFRIAAQNLLRQVYDDWYHGYVRFSKNL